MNRTTMLNKWRKSSDSVNKRIMSRVLYNNECDLSPVDRTILNDNIDDFDKIDPTTLNKEVCLRMACLLGSKKIATHIYHGRFLVPDSSNDKRLFEYICYSNNLEWIKEILAVEMKDYQKRTIPFGINMNKVNDNIKSILKRTFCDTYWL